MKRAVLISITATLFQVSTSTDVQQPWEPNTQKKGRWEPPTNQGEFGLGWSQETFMLTQVLKELKEMKEAQARQIEALKSSRQAQARQLAEIQALRTDQALQLEQLVLMRKTVGRLEHVNSGLKKKVARLENTQAGYTKLLTSVKRTVVESCTSGNPNAEGTMRPGNVGGSGLRVKQTIKHGKQAPSRNAQDSALGNDKAALSTPSSSKPGSSEDLSTKSLSGYPSCVAENAAVGSGMLDKSKLSSARECFAKCGNTEECAAWGYYTPSEGSEKGRCYLFSQMVQDLTQQNGKEGWLSGVRDCDPKA